VINRPATVVIRVDSGDEIGAGHVRRCLSIADFLSKNDFRPVFICRQIAGDISYLIEQAGFEIVLLPPSQNLKFSVFGERFSSADFKRMAIDARESASRFVQQYPATKSVAWAITDHMLIRKPWQALFANKLDCMILAIDGIADYPHDANILIDPQISENPSEKWSGLVPDNCAVLSGPSCLPLSLAFESARKSAGVRNGPISRVLICFGGTDPHQIVHRSVSALLAWIEGSGVRQIAVDVVIPSNFSAIEKVKILLEKHQRCHLHVGLSDLSVLMLGANIAIGGGGIMLWERCLMGLPAIVVPLAENQEKPINRLKRQGAVLALSSVGEGYESELTKALDQLLKSPALLMEMSETSLKVMADWPATEGWLKLMKSSCNE